MYQIDVHTFGEAHIRNCSCQAHRSEPGFGALEIHNVFLSPLKSYETPDILNQTEPS